MYARRGLLGMSHDDYVQGKLDGYKMGFNAARAPLNVIGFGILLIAFAMATWVPIIFVLRWAWTRWV